MNKIVIGFSRPSAWFSPFSWLIRIAYWSPYSHTYIRFYSKEYDKDFVLQASGLRINLLEKTLFDSEEIIYKEFEIPIKPKNKKGLINFALSQLGKPYNLIGIAGMGWVRMGQILGFKTKSPFEYNGSSDFCSELVAKLLQTYDDIDFGESVADISPKDVFNVVSKAIIKNK